MDTGFGRSQPPAPSPASAPMAVVSQRAARIAGTIELDIAGAVLRLRGPVDEVGAVQRVARAAPHRMIGLRAGTRAWLPVVTWTGTSTVDDEDAAPLSRFERR